jgi:hypothetical protein
MMIKASTLAIAVVGSLAVATAGESFAAPIPSGALAIKVATPAAATDVQYRTYFDSYAYRPAYPCGGYTYWYPSYGNWAYPGVSARKSILCPLTLTWNGRENAVLYAAYQCLAPNHSLRASTMFFIASVATPLLIIPAQPREAA